MLPSEIRRAIIDIVEAEGGRIKTEKLIKLLEAMRIPRSEAMKQLGWFLANGQLREPRRGEIALP